MTAAVFDVGGVLIDWNPRHLYRKLFNGDEAAMERFLAEVCTPAWNHRQDEGRSWTDGIAELVARHPHQASLISAYDDRWEEMVPAAFPASIAIIEELKNRGTKLYCLTNFAQDKFLIMRRRYAVFNLFDGIVVSADVGLAKPDPAIFRYLLQRHDLRAPECLFIDDVPANIESARQLGFDTHLFRSALELREWLRVKSLL